jgi:hypothetical protein
VCRISGGNDYRLGLPVSVSELFFRRNRGGHWRSGALNAEVEGSSPSLSTTNRSIRRSREKSVPLNVTMVAFHATQKAEPLKKLLGDVLGALTSSLPSGQTALYDPFRWLRGVFLQMQARTSRRM